MQGIVVVSQFQHCDKYQRLFYIMATRTRKDKTSIQGLVKQLRKSTNCRSF